MIFYTWSQVLPRPSVIEYASLRNADSSGFQFYRVLSRPGRIETSTTLSCKPYEAYPMSDSLCKNCEHLREVVSGTGSRFLFCQLSQTNSRFPKYPPQPIVECLGYRPQSEAGNAVTGDDAISKPDTLCLDQFLKLNAIAESGGQAKVMIQSGQVRVNGEVETRRRRKLVADDVIEVGGDKWPVKDSVSFK